MKEKAYYLHYKDNGNSWNRIMMLLRLYWPGLKPSFIICALYPFFAYIFVIVAKKYFELSLEWLLGAPLTLLMCGSPIILSKRDYRHVCAQLPVTRAEKFGLLLLTFFIGIPLIMDISINLAQLLCKVLFGTKIPIEIYTMLQNGPLEGLKVPHLLGSIIICGSFISVVLYYVVTAKN